MEEKNDCVHTVVIDNREIINITTVDEVISSTEKEVYAKVNGKEILQINGEGLKIVKLIPEERLLTITGKINGLLYSAKLNKKSLFGKVFK